MSLKYDGVESMDRRMTYWTSIFGTSCSIYREPRTWRPPTLPLALCAVNAARDEVDDGNLVSVVDGEMMMVFCCCAAGALPELSVRWARLRRRRLRLRLGCCWARWLCMETPLVMLMSLPLDVTWGLLMRLDVTERVGPPSPAGGVVGDLALAALLGLLVLRRLLIPGGVGSTLVALLLELLLGHVLSMLVSGHPVDLLVAG